eukprot:10722902-Lingulodinium_polyedra.AAC.1
MRRLAVASVVASKQNGEKRPSKPSFKEEPSERHARELVRGTRFWRCVLCHRRLTSNEELKWARVPCEE